VSQEFALIRKNVVKAYHQHQHLLMQFIWSELILAHGHSHKTLEVLDKLKHTKKMTSRNSLLYELKNHITTLSGSAHDYMRLFAWGDDGILAKLKNYCSLFTQTKINLGHNQEELYKEANKAWLLSLEALDIIRVLSQHKSHSEDALCSITKKMHNSIEKIRKLLEQIVLHFSHDENILMFILRNQEALEKLHKRNFVKHVLNAMYPKGLEAAQKLLVKKYTARGFSQLIPFIRSKISQLQ